MRSFLELYLSVSEKVVSSRARKFQDSLGRGPVELSLSDIGTDKGLFLNSVSALSFPDVFYDSRRYRRFGETISSDISDIRKDRSDPVFGCLPIAQRCFFVYFDNKKTIVPIAQYRWTEYLNFSRDPFFDGEISVLGGGSYGTDLEPIYTDEDQFWKALKSKYENTLPFFVDQDFRKMGIGSLLIAAVLAFYDSRGVTFFDSGLLLPSAERLWRKFGLTTNKVEVGENFGLSREVEENTIQELLASPYLEETVKRLVKGSLRIKTLRERDEARARERITRHSSSTWVPTAQNGLRAPTYLSLIFSSLNNQSP